MIAQRFFPASSPWRRLARVSLGAAFALLAAAVPAVAKDGDDPDRKLLGQYEAMVKDLAQRAQRQLTQLEADVQTLGARFAGQVVGKPFYEGRDGGLCNQKQVLIGNVDARDEAAFRALTTPLPTVTFSRTDFDRWLAGYSAEFREARQYVDRTLKVALDLFAQKRRDLDNIDSSAVSQRLGGDWKAQQHRGVMLDLGPSDFLKSIYHVVIQEYFSLIWLGVWELGGGIMTSGPPPPPGVACVIEAELSSREFAAQKIVATLWKAHRERVDAGRHKEVEAHLPEERAAVQKCADGELAARDEAARRLRAVRDRFYAERDRLRQRMLQWREEGVGARLHAGTGDAAISRVYGTPAALGPENIQGFHYWTPMGGFTDKFSGRPNWPTKVWVDTICLKNVDQSQSGYRDLVTVKHPDLEVDQAFVLEIRSSASRVIESILSGAGASTGP